MINPKQLDYYKAIVDVLTIFSESEIGGEIVFNNERISAYLNSFEASARSWNCVTYDDFCECFTQDILNGFPVWRLLVLPEWTERMVEDMFTRELNTEEEKRRSKYKCLTCKYLEEHIMSLGTSYKCLYRKQVTEDYERRRSRKLALTPRDRKPFELKTTCKNYEHT